jgi:tetratricopeptide (TPR) repeat protein
VPHPPGYPLWAFLGWMWRHFVPFGNPAWRICLMSVLTGALVVGVLTLLMTRSIMMLLRSVTWAETLEDSMRHWIARTIGATSALLFGFNRGVWLWACVPEMRVLNVFMFVIMACTFFAWMMRPQRHGLLYATILMYALGIANHMTAFVMALPFMVGALAVGGIEVLDQWPLRFESAMVKLSAFWELMVALLFSWAAWAWLFGWLQTSGTGSVMSQQINMFILFGPQATVGLLVFAPLIVGCVLLFWFGSERWLSRKTAIICTTVFLIGCSFYFYMPVASATNPPMNWGYSYTKQGFLHHITRGQYERLNIASPLSKAFFIQIGLFVRALLQQLSPPLGFELDYLLGVPLFLLALLTLGVLVLGWKTVNHRGRAWLIFVWAAFLTTSYGMLMIINPGLDKQNQEINIKFFAPAHGFFVMMIGYGLALAAAWTLVRLSHFPRVIMRGLCVALLALPLIPFNRNWRICEQRNHDFGYQFGYRMFKPGGGYPEMDRDAVLYGGTDPGRFVPTYMIFCESRVAPKDRYHDPNLDPEGGANFDRRDVTIITQNALADSTYMSYVRDHYDFSRPDPNNPQTLQRRLPWQQALFRWGWHHLHRDSMYPKEPIWIPSEQDTQRAFQEYVNQVQERKARGEQLSADEQVTVEGGQVQVRGVAGVMKINGILTKWIFDHSKDKHSFYVEESYVIDWMYPYLTPAGIIMKINRDPLPTPEQNPQLWTEIVNRDKAYWNKLCEEFDARPEFRRDSDAQKTFSKLRSAIGGVYANRRLVVEAEYAYKQALQLCPESPEANFRLAQLYMELSRPDDALATLRALQKLDPLNDKIQTAIQQILNMKQSRQEVGQLESARATNSRDFTLLGQLAQAYSRAGQNDRIAPLLNSYLAQTNVAPDDILQAAQAFMNLGRVDDALATLQLMMRRFPQDARPYFAFALVRTAQNNTAEAISMLEKAIELAPQLRKQAAEDQRLNSLRSNPEFQKLIKPQ